MYKYKLVTSKYLNNFKILLVLALLMNTNTSINNQWFKLLMHIIL